MVTVPALTPVTIPVADTVAFALLADHVPPAAASDNEMVAPATTVLAPDIEPAFIPLTVIGYVL